VLTARDLLNDAFRDVYSDTDVKQWWANFFRSGPQKKFLAGHNDLL